MPKIIITGTGLITSAGNGPGPLLAAMASETDFFSHRIGRGKSWEGTRQPWPVAPVPWSDIAWPEGEIWANNKKYANVAAHGAVAAAIQAIGMAGIADERDAARCGTVVAVGSSNAEELGKAIQELAVLSETDPRPLATLLYDESPDFSYIRGIPSQIGQFVAMATGFRGSNVVVYGESGAGGLSALSFAARLIQSGELDRVMVVGVAPPLPLGVLAALERDDSIGTEAIPGRGPFDMARAGTLVGQAAVAIMLEREAVADARGVTPMAELVACETLTAATRRAALDAVTRSVLEQSGQCPGMWWACGAGSVALDLEECQSVGPQVNAPVTSSKGTIGNTFECAGLIDVVLALESLQQEQLPPVGLLRNPDPALGNIDFVVGASRALPGVRSAFVTALGSGPNTTAGAAMLARRLN